MQLFSLDNMDQTLQSVDGKKRIKIETQQGQFTVKQQNERGYWMCLDASANPHEAVNTANTFLEMRSV